MTPEQKTWIDNASLVELLRKWRHSAPGSEPMFMETETSNYFQARMFKLRSDNNDAWVAASKIVGW